MSKASSRRDFVKRATLGTAAIGVAPQILAATYQQKIQLHRNYRPELFTANDQIQLGLIGCGIQGIYDTTAALRVPGFQLVAVCDLYTGRLDRAKELWGPELFTTRDYRQLLGRKDLDAVIIATPDHWHQPITIAALKAGKAVYCEKPMIRRYEEGQEIIKVQKETGSLCQIGSQGMSSLGNEKAKQLYKDGAIGELILVDMFNDRYSAEGAWQYPIPPDADATTVDFDTFLGNAPKVPYDNKRFFRWRNYQDYGTGVAGDLFVHEFSTLHFILDSMGPVSAQSTGGLRYWKDGRDVPDVMLTLYDFPETKTHPAFNANFRINFVAGSGGGGVFRLVGTEGAMEVDSNLVTLKRSKLNMVPEGYSMIAYTEATQKLIRSAYETSNPENREADLKVGETTFEASDDYKGSHYDHFHNFAQAIRGEKTIIQDPTFGLRAGGAALLANESYFNKKIVNWDPVGMKMV